MAVQTAQLTIGTTAVELTVTATDRQAGSAIALTAPDAADLFVGPANVTTTTGYRIKAGTSFAADLQSGERLYGRLATGTGTVYVLRSGV